MTRSFALCGAMMLVIVLGGAPETRATTAPAMALPHDRARLGFRRIEGFERPGLILAQRTIDRSWGLSDDSTYVDVEVPGWKSEPTAALLSAVLPGAGQRYVGESGAWVYAAIEAAGWGGWWWYRHEAGRLRDRAVGLVGLPDDPASGWSFERWAEATQGDPLEIMTLYAGDVEAFYNSIASDPKYQAGWASLDARNDFGGLRLRADARLNRSRIYSTGLWINHLVAAVNALRAARFNNMPLSRQVGVRFDGGLRGGVPEFAVTLVRKF